MNTKHWLIGTLAAAALALGLSAPASAGSIMCEPSSAATGSQAGVIGGTGSAVPSQALYVQNAEGCAAVAAADVGYFRSQGWYPGPNLFSVTTTGITAQTTAANSPVLPAGAFIEGIVIKETAGQAVTGGLDIGIAGSSDQTIVAAFAVPANATIAVTPSSILRFTFGAAGAASGAPSAQAIYFNAHTNWSDAASVNVTIFYSLYMPY